MKIKLVLFLILISAISSAQNYFEGKRFYCRPSNQAAEKMDLAIRAMHYPKYLGASSNLFLEMIKKDSTFCDAYFFAGYTLMLQDRLREAVVYYYMADSLSGNKSIEFKINLASAALKSGDTVLPRRSYRQIVQYFPDSPEGYYGMALTSTIIGDVEKGLQNIETAVEKHRKFQSEISDDTEMLWAVLLNRNTRFAESIPHFEKCKSAFKNDDIFNVHYSVSLMQVAKANNDEKMKQKAFKIFKRVKDKTPLLPHVIAMFQT